MTFEFTKMLKDGVEVDVLKTSQPEKHTKYKDGYNSIEYEDSGYIISHTFIVVEKWQSYVEESLYIDIYVIENHEEHSSKAVETEYWEDTLTDLQELIINLEMEIIELKEQLKEGGVENEI